MNYGGDAADQIVRYSLEGVDHGIRLTGSLAKNLAVFIAAVLKDTWKNTHDPHTERRQTVKVLHCAFRQAEGILSGREEARTFVRGDPG